MVLTKTISDFQKFDFLRLTLNLTYSNKCILNCLVYRYSRIHTILIYKTVMIVVHVIAFCRKRKMFAGVRGTISIQFTYTRRQRQET